MSNESKNEFCNGKKLAEKLLASVKENEKLAKMIRDLRQENEGLQTELRYCSSGSNESRSGTTGDDNGSKEKFDAILEINHGWKDYEDLQMPYEMLSSEKRLLDDQERKLNGRIYELKKRQKSLEGEIARLAGALFAQHGSNGGPSPKAEEQCESFKSQMVVYKEDFERERQHRENLHEERRNINTNLRMLKK